LSGGIRRREKGRSHDDGREIIDPGVVADRLQVSPYTVLDYRRKG
jgi:hypothetical protein